MAQPRFVTAERYSPRNQKFGVVAAVAVLAGIGLFISNVTLAGKLSKPPREVWIAVRSDGRAGKGTVTDPYNGSTQGKFDMRVASVGPNTLIHLGPGTFQTAWNHSWRVKDGWCFVGAGMNA